MNDRKKGQFLVQVGWDEAPHLDEEAKDQILAQYLPNDREMRTKGQPEFGRGKVFPYSIEKLVVEDIQDSTRIQFDNSSFIGFVTHFP